MKPALKWLRMHARQRPDVGQRLATSALRENIPLLWQPTCSESGRSANNSSPPFSAPFPIIFAFAFPVIFAFSFPVIFALAFATTLAFATLLRRRRGRRSRRGNWRRWWRRCSALWRNCRQTCRLGRRCWRRRHSWWRSRHIRSTRRWRRWQVICWRRRRRKRGWRRRPHGRCRSRRRWNKALRRCLSYCL